MDGVPQIGLTLRQTGLFFGPNLFARDPVVVCEIAVAGLEPLDVRAGLHAVLAQYPDHATDLDGVLPDPALAIATLLAFWTKSVLNDTRGFINSCGAHSEGSGRAMLWVGFHEVETTRAALGLAGRMISSAIRAPHNFRAAALAPLYRDLQDRCRATHPDFQARILMVAARDLDVPVLPFIKEQRLWQYGWGARARVFFETSSHEDSALGSRISRSKKASKEMFRRLGIPTPSGLYVSRIEDLPQVAQVVGWPCVVKPDDCGGGKGVTVGIDRLGDLEKAFVHARTFSAGPVLVEPFVAGDDFRLTVIDGKLVAATRRDPPFVCGDGTSQIQALIDQLNASRSANMVRSNYRAPVMVNELLVDHLGRQGLRLDSILERDRRATLLGNANRSTGATCADVLDIVDDVLRRMTESLVVTTGLYAAGLDYITSDITKPPSLAGGCFIEINATPGLAVIVASGLSEAAIGSLILGTRVGRIPAVLVVTSAPPPGTLVRALRQKAAGTPGLGWLCGEEAGIDRVDLSVSHLPIHDRPSVLLNHRSAQAVIIVSTMDDICRSGSPIDRADRGILYDVAVPAHWRDVFETVCGQIVETASMSEALSAIDDAIVPK